MLNSALVRIFNAFVTFDPHPSYLVSDDAHNAIQAAATADHGSHSNNLVVNDPDVNSFLVYALNVFLTLELHKFPGSPASVCDNLATGTVWVEYNDSVSLGFLAEEYLYSQGIRI
jgi:hypothetical protein